MRTGWKVFWIVCAALGGLGLVLVIAGLALGASASTIDQAFDYDFSRITQTVRDNISDEIQDNTEGQVQGTSNMGQEYQGIRELKASIRECEVIVEYRDGQGITLDTSRLNHSLNLAVKQDGDELKIDSNDHHFTGHKNAGQLYIFLPKNDTLQNADFEIGAGTLHIGEITVDELDISVGAGTANVASCTANDISVECGAGQVELKLASAIEEYNYSVELALGEVSIGGESFSGVAMERDIDNRAAKDVSVECGVGKVTVAFEAGI